MNAFRAGAAVLLMTTMSWAGCLDPQPVVTEDDGPPATLTTAWPAVGSYAEYSLEDDVRNLRQLFWVRAHTTVLGPAMAPVEAWVVDTWRSTDGRLRPGDGAPDATYLLDDDGHVIHTVYYSGPDGFVSTGTSGAPFLGGLGTAWGGTLTEGQAATDRWRSPWADGAKPTVTTELIERPAERDTRYAIRAVTEPGDGADVSVNRFYVDGDDAWPMARFSKDADGEVEWFARVAHGVHEPDEPAAEDLPRFTPAGDRIPWTQPFPPGLLGTLTHFDLSPGDAWDAFAKDETVAAFLDENPDARISRLRVSPSHSFDDGPYGSASQERSYTRIRLAPADAGPMISGEVTWHRETKLGAETRNETTVDVVEREAGNAAPNASGLYDIRIPVHWTCELGLLCNETYALEFAPRHVGASPYAWATHTAVTIWAPATDTEAHAYYLSFSLENGHVVWASLPAELAGPFAGYP